jgi:uncharacterized protein (DUF58 family)
LTTSDILKQVRKIEITARKKAARLFSGEYHAAFKGKGMLFKEVRDYYPGDDIRFIDWNTSARFGHPFSKVFEEERERTVWLMVDISSSTLIPGNNGTLRNRITEIAATLAFSALANQDKTGALLFSDKIEKVIKPAKGRQHLLYIISALLAHQPATGTTNLKPALKWMQQVAGKRAIVFLLSDMAFELPESQLSMLAALHDTTALHVYDETDNTLPTVGLLPLTNPESGEVMWVDTQSDNFTEVWQDWLQRRKLAVQQAIKRSGWDYAAYAIQQDYTQTLRSFFNKRLHRP